MMFFFFRQFQSVEVSISSSSVVSIIIVPRLYERKPSVHCLTIVRSNKRHLLQLWLPVCKKLHTERKVTAMAASFKERTPVPSFGNNTELHRIIFKLRDEGVKVFRLVSS